MWFGLLLEPVINLYASIGPNVCLCVGIHVQLLVHYGGTFVVQVLSHDVLSWIIKTPKYYA